MDPFCRRALALLLVAVAVAAGTGPAAGEDASRGWLVDRVRFEPARGFLEVGGVGVYRGAIEVGTVDGKLAVVNQVDVEDYVKGIAEVPARWPAAALEAQAIAARTYGLNQLLSARSRHRPLGAHICATQACQVYGGLAREKRPHGERWVAAVEATRGQVLLFRGAPIFAQYSSTNGGRTVRGSRPYLWEVDDPDDAVSPYHRWQVSFPVSEVGTLLSIEDPIVAAARQGDLVTLVVRHSDGSESGLQYDAASLRRRLNQVFGKPADLPLAVPSVRFGAWVADEELVLDGRGWGHGVGMSQYGALGKAQRGMAAADILAAYYGGIRPVRLPPDRLPSIIRVTVATEQDSVRVSSTGSFRVLDREGRPLVGLGAGSWELRPEEGAVRVIPPEGYHRPVQAASLDPPAPAEGQDPTLRFALAAPAEVRVRVAGPSVAATLVQEMLEPGRYWVTLRNVAVPGNWEVVLEASTGVNDAAVPIRYRIGPPAELGRAHAAGLGRPDPRSPSKLGPAAVALLLVLGVGAALAGQVRLRTSGR